jgi:DNA-binding IclR family transcriptional regulator
MDTITASGVTGTQVIARASAILRTVSTHSTHGVTTSEVALACDLTRPTAHRLLSSLAAEGFLDFDARQSRWMLGPELFLMGNLAAPRFDIIEIARPLVQELADVTGESAFLSARRASETVCLLRIDGAFPVRSFVLYEGVRFPLGIGSAGIAILAFLPDEEIEDHLKNRQQLAARRGEQHDDTEIRERIARTRELGYAVNPGLLVEGSWGMGAAIFDAAGRPAWALSLTGIESRFRVERQSELGPLLVTKAHQASQMLKSSLS